MGDLLSSISVLLVFLTFLLNLAEKQIDGKIAERTPDLEQKENRKKFKCGVIMLFVCKALPIALIFLTTFYALFPRTLHIIKTSDFSLRHFDELNTIFVFIEAGLFGLTTYVFYKCYQLIQKFREK